MGGIFSSFLRQNGGRAAYQEQVTGAAMLKMGAARVSFVVPFGKPRFVALLSKYIKMQQSKERSDNSRLLRASSAVAVNHSREDSYYGSTPNRIPRHDVCVTI